VASKEAIMCIRVTEESIFVAGCESNIRAYDIETGDTKLYEGHKGWIYDLQVHEERLYSACDDSIVIIWDVESCRMLYKLVGHENGVTSIAFAFNDIYTGSFDHHVFCWDYPEIIDRVEEKEMMRAEDIETRQFETYWKV